MEPDGEGRMLLGQLHGFGGGVLVDHQARAGKNSLRVRADDSMVDATRSPEIVRVYYDRLHGSNSSTGSVAE
jgi:hypothetical protein